MLEDNNNLTSASRQYGFVHKTVRLCFTLVALGVWTILGFVFWIPLLLRATAYLSSMIVIASFSRKVDMHVVQQRLDFAIDFYAYGYRRVLDVMEARADSATVVLENFEPLNLEDVILSNLADIIWTVVFWGSLMVFL